MTKKDYYKILGLSRSSNIRDIKRAYKRLAIKYHPDRNQDTNASNMFKEVKEAYEVLSDSKKRKLYDQYGHSAFENVGFDQNFHSSNDFSDIFGDVFGDIFGGNYSKKPIKGSDLSYTVELTLEEAVKGVNKDIKILVLDKCILCKGEGTKDGIKPIKCKTCNGYGQIKIQQGFFTVQQTCTRCRGKGSIIKDVCKKCYGNGRVKILKTLSIKIPAGIDVGDKIRIVGKGEAGDNNAPYGDLYIHAKIKKHSIFKREKNNLYCEIPINFTMAALGGEVVVPTLDGNVNLKIPKETQTGKLFRMKFKGVKSLQNNSIGDLFCRVVVETPINLNKSQKRILKKLDITLDDSSIGKNTPRSKTFFDGVKKFFDDLTI